MGTAEAGLKWEAITSAAKSVSPVVLTVTEIKK